jgi:hypothetical protein
MDFIKLFGLLPGSPTACSTEHSTKQLVSQLADWSLGSLHSQAGWTAVDWRCNQLLLLAGKSKNVPSASLGGASLGFY